MAGGLDVLRKEHVVFSLETFEFNAIVKKKSLILCRTSQLQRIYSINSSEVMLKSNWEVESKIR